MTVRRAPDGTIELDGVCPIEDAESLHRHLLENPRSTVDWSACDSAHTAVIQILLALQPTLRGPPRGDFLREYIDPLLADPRGQ
jgi:hypothetical protein